MKTARNSELFYLASDIFSYPDEKWARKLERLGKLAGEKFEYNGSLEDIQASYINFFEHNSSKFHIVPVAAYWIDGRLDGESAQKIAKFYEMCGLKFEGFGSCDHIGKMFAFCAWLLENDKFSEFEAFKEWFFWLDEFGSNLNKIPELRPFYQVLVVCSKLLNDKEHSCNCHVQSKTPNTF